MGHINLHKLLLVGDALDNCHWNTTLAKLVIVGGEQEDFTTIIPSKLFCCGHVHATVIRMT